MNTNLRDKMFENNRKNLVGTVITQFFSALVITYSAVFLQKIMDLGLNGTTNDIITMAIATVLYIILAVVIEFLKRHFKNCF